MKDKETHSIELEQAQYAFLEEMAEKYDLDDAGKAMRCLVNYAREEDDRLSEIFEEIRCVDC